MLQHGIINPDILNLLARVRHTNALVISDRGFPYWPMIETIDISLVDGIPTVTQVLQALRGNFDVVEAYMAEEFRLENSAQTKQRFADALSVPITFEPHLDLKKRVPDAIGLIRTGDTTQYANIVLYSGRPE